MSGELYDDGYESDSGGIGTWSVLGRSALSGVTLPASYRAWLQDTDGSVQMGTVTVYPTGRREIVYEGERYTRDQWDRRPRDPLDSVPHPDIGPGEEI